MKGGDAEMTDEPLVDAAEVSRILGVKRSTVHKYEERGKLVPAETRYEGLRRKPMFRRSDVEKLRQPREGEEAANE
jgi:DNA-binding transcriptional MerR regulator